MTRGPVDGRAVRYPLTIYHDGACPLCATEMRTLTDLDIDGRLALFDVAGGRLDAACRAAGLTTDDLLASIHARDAAGRWWTGIDVFVAAYRAAGLTAVAALLDHRRTRPMWDRLYPTIARHRDRLARLGLQHLFRLVPKRWLLARARRAARRAAGCAEGVCGVPGGRSPVTPEA